MWRDRQGIEWLKAVGYGASYDKITSSYPPQVGGTWKPLQAQQFARVPERANGPSPADPSGQRFSTACSRDVDCHTIEILQNSSNTRKLFSMIIVFTGRPSTCLHSNCASFSGAVLINPFWEGTHTCKDPLLHNLTYFPRQNKPYPPPQRYCYPQLFAGIATMLLLLRVRLCWQNSSMLPKLMKEKTPVYIF